MLNKDYQKQPEVLRDVIEQRKTNSHIAGLMLESNLKEGSQSDKFRYGDPLFEPATLDPEISVTDGCLGLQQTCALVREAHHRYT